MFRQTVVCPAFSLEPYHLEPRAESVRHVYSSANFRVRQPYPLKSLLLYAEVNQETGAEVDYNNPLLSLQQAHLLKHTDEHVSTQCMQLQ